MSVLLAIPTYGFTVPLKLAIIAHTLAVLFYIMFLVVFGERQVIEGAVPAVLAVVLFAMLSYAWQRVKQSEERIRQRQIQSVP